MDNFSILYSNIFLAKSRRQFTAAAFLDIKAAYDNVLPDILMKKLIKLKIQNKILSFVQNLIYYRRVTCRFDEIDEIRWAYRGLPQGSVLSPLLYNIYVAEIQECCSDNCSLIQYADDIAILCNGKNIDFGKAQVELTIKNIKKKLDALGLSLPVEKTKFCIFDLRKRNRIRNNLIYFNIDKTRIKSSSQIKFLGINFETN